MENYKLGLVSVSFRDKSPEEILTEMKKQGLKYIEWGSDVHAPCDNMENLYRIAELQKKYCIECCSYGTYFRLGVTPIDELLKYISAAKILGTDVLRLWCGNKNSGDYSKGEKEKLFAECKKAALIAEKNDVTLCMECHSGTYTDTEKSALELMNTVNSPNFLMYWQPQQYKSREENISYAKNISPYSKHIHVFNWEKDRRFSLAEGIDKWKEYLSYFSKDKTLLLEFMPDDNINSLKDESASLRNIIKE